MSGRDLVAEGIANPRGWRNRADVIAFVDALCRDGGREHEINPDTHRCRRCGMTREMLAEIPR